MKAIVVEDAHILIPNKDHKNFTTSNEVIEAETQVEGRPTIIKGMRRGEPFDYKFFITNKKQIIHLNKIKPMETTEVTLGADAKQTATVIDVPGTKKLLTKTVLMGAGIGAAVGFGYAKYKKLDNKKMAIYTLVGAAIGFFAGKYVEKRKGIVIKPSK